MGTILACYNLVEPAFPATDQHPSAIRQRFGQRWFDVISGPITQADVDAYDSKNAADTSAANDQNTLVFALSKIAFNHENRIRALEGKSPITLAQFIAAVRNL